MNSDPFHKRKVAHEKMKKEHKDKKIEKAKKIKEILLKNKESGTENITNISGWKLDEKENLVKC